MAHNIFKSIQKMAGQAANAVLEDEQNKEWERQRSESLRQAMMPTPLYTYATNYTPTSAAQNITTSGTYNVTTAGGSAPGIGGFGRQYAPGGVIYKSAASPAPTLTFSDEQQASFLAKLGELLTKGWECLRCHRIWSPQVTGCEFCNFIDRLEGKDVERDTAA